MAEVIEFYIPKHFRQKLTRGSLEGGKLIEFSLAADLLYGGPRATCGDPSERCFESAAGKVAASISKKFETHVSQGYIGFWE
jgi:hypothetical protein